MDGLMAVVDHMDLRYVSDQSRVTELNIDQSQVETGHWDSGACPKYIDIRTEASEDRDQMDIQREQMLTMAGRDRNLVGYC